MYGGSRQPTSNPTRGISSSWPHAHSTRTKSPAPGLRSAHRRGVASAPSVAVMFSDNARPTVIVNGRVRHVRSTTAHVQLVGRFPDGHEKIRANAMVR